MASPWGSRNSASAAGPSRYPDALPPAKVETCPFEVILRIQ